MSEPNDIITVTNLEGYRVGNTMTVSGSSPQTGLWHRRYERIDGKWVEQDIGG